MSDYQQLLDILIKQEEELQFDKFTNETALQLGMKFIEKGKTENLPIVIDISRNGQQLFHYAFPGTTPDNDQWIIRKNRAVNRFYKSSYRVGIFLQTIGKTLEQKYFISSLEYSAIGGSFPIIVKNIGVVGTIAVSGLTQEDDHNVVVSTIRDFLENK
jgi:uncharacterized protein (UPF0303 family)